MADKLTRTLLDLGYSRAAIKAVMKARKGGKSKNKFNAKPKVYNGVLYASGDEADYARELDLRLKAGRIMAWERQLEYVVEVNNRLICKYYLDFRVRLPDGSIEHIDVKGVQTRESKLKIKLVEAIYGINIILIKMRG